jgi:hypothetical protein
LIKHNLVERKSINYLDYHITALKYSAIGIGALFGLMMIAAWTCFFIEYFKREGDFEKKEKKKKELNVYDDEKADHLKQDNDDEQLLQQSKSEPIL